MKRGFLSNAFAFVANAGVIGGIKASAAATVALNPFGLGAIAAIAAMGMLLSVLGDQKKAPNLSRAGERIESAIKQTTPKMKSMSAGEMGFPTTQIGDLVASSL